MGVLQAEMLAQVQTAIKAKYFAKLFEVSSENILCFSYNQACLHLIQNFPKNFLCYAPFFVRNCKKLIDYGIPLKNSLWVPSNVNLIDIVSRPETMNSETLELFLGAWDSSKFTYQKDSKFLGNFEPSKFIFENSYPEDGTSNLQGLYETTYDPKFVSPSARMSKTLLAIMDDPSSRKANNCSNSESIVNKISTFWKRSLKIDTLISDKPLSITSKYLLVLISCSSNEKSTRVPKKGSDVCSLLYLNHGK